jgi:hypothetical protein
MAAPSQQALEVYLSTENPLPEWAIASAAAGLFQQDRVM